jgi:hypothetical protein
MTDEEKRLVAFLAKRMCGPCRRDRAVAEHEGCVEAEEFIEIVQQNI